MKHTTHYRVTVNHFDHIVTLDKPLESAMFFKDPYGYCESQDTKSRALIHYSNLREEHYFRNLYDARRYFRKLHKSNYFYGYDFNDVFDEM